MDIQILNPLEIRNWDELLLSNENSSFFHSSPWAKVLHDTYGYKPIYFCSLENGKLSSLMPFMEVNSWLTGKRGVSLPFTDACDSITCDIEAFRTAVNAVKEYGREVCWKTVEWRGNGEYLADAPPSSSYFTHMLQLGDPEEQIFSGFKSNTRRNINKAIKEGVRVKIGNSLESVELYYRLHCRTRRHHGLPPQPFSFFKKVFEHIINKGWGFVALAFLKSTCLAGAIFFYFGKMANYKFGASSRKHQHLRPNNLVMWEAIRECIKRGSRKFSFGRTATDNKGLLQFKRSWNPQEGKVHYYKYDLRKNSFLTKSIRVKGFYNEIFNVTPIPVLRLVGAAVYKHLG